MSGDVEGKVILVTGAASGIGAATARLWRERGGVAVGADLVADDDDKSVLACDVTVETDVAETIARVRDEHGRLDAILHSAGVLGPAAAVTDLPLADWRRVMDVHATAGFLLAKHGIPAIGASGGGALLFIGSIVAADGSAPHPAYAAGKAALISLAKSLAASAGRNQVRVNVISPGSVVGTGLLQAERGFGLTLPELAQLAGSIPVGRATTTRDIAETACFLASPAGRQITGTELVVDGGERLPLRAAPAPGKSGTGSAT